MSDANPHPEDYCERCHHRIRFNYSADNECWNTVVGRESKAVWGIICIDCFIELCQAQDIEPKFVAFHIPDSEFHINISEKTEKPKRIITDLRINTIYPSDPIRRKYNVCGSETCQTCGEVEFVCLNGFKSEEEAEEYLAKMKDEYDDEK